MNGSQANIKYGLQLEIDTASGIAMSPVAIPAVTEKNLNPLGNDILPLIEDLIQ